MRALILIILVRFSFFAGAQDQHFKWTDSTFRIGQINRDYNIPFKLLDYDFTSLTYPHLDSIYLFLWAHPSVRIEIRGNCDCRGNPVALRLSMARAKAVKDFLVQKGIAEDRIRAMSYGDTRPVKIEEDLVLIVKDKTMTVPGGTLLSCKYIRRIPSKDFQEALHQLNRRFDFIITAL